MRAPTKPPIPAATMSLVGEVGADAAALDERAHDRDARHDQRQRGHEAEAVQPEVPYLEEDGSHQRFTWT